MVWQGRMRMLMVGAEPLAAEVSAGIRLKSSGLSITHLRNTKRGGRTEVHKKILPMPQRQWGENYLHAYFLPDDNVYLWWSTGFNSPSAEDIAAQAAEKQRQNMH